MSVTKPSLYIAIVDDHPIVMEGLQKILMQVYDQLSTICFTTGSAFLDFIKSGSTSIDIVLLDITLPDSNGIELCKQIKTLLPSTYVLAFSNHNERSTIMRMLQNGASGYLLKNAPAGEVVACINDVLNGQIAFSNEVKEILANPSPQDLRIIPTLTKREKEILKLVAEGKTSNVIAAQLHLSPLTIETHRRNLMQKFEVKNMAAAIKIAAENNLL